MLPVDSLSSSWYINSPFIEKVLKICQDFGVNHMVQTQLQNLMKCYSWNLS